VPPGDRLNPYRLGTAATLVQGWRLKVNSAILNADSQVEAVLDSDGQPANGPPAAGAQYTLVNVSMTYVGGGSSDLGQYLQFGVNAEGAGNATYNVYGCTPAPLDLSRVFQPVYSGQTEIGNLCFEIASNDAASLLLTGEGMAGDAELPVWFALR